MFGLPSLSMFSVADGTGTRPNNSPADMTALQKALAAIRASNHTPAGRVARGFDQFGPQAYAPQAPMLPTPPTPGPVDMSSPTPPPPALSAQAQAIPPAAPPGVPMPIARPPEAPQPQPDMGFFARNAAMMRDPSSGDFIDPMGAQRAQASGPDVINKLLDMFHKKDT